MVILLGSFFIINKRISNGRSKSNSFLFLFLHLPNLCFFFFFVEFPWFSFHLLGMSDISKESVKKSLETGIYSLESKPDGATADWWSHFNRVRDADGKLLPFVRCRRCSSLFSYDNKKTGTSSLSTHTKHCRSSTSNGNQNIASLFGRQTISNVSAATKSRVTEALANMCATDIRPFDVVSGSGFAQFCQTLLDVGRKTHDQINAQALLPDPTTVSRRVQSIADGTTFYGCLSRFFHISLIERQREREREKERVSMKFRRKARTDLNLFQSLSISNQWFPFSQTKRTETEIFQQHGSTLRCHTRLLDQQIYFRFLSNNHYPLRK